ncbi:hypothetical protein OBBRIDRAFT_106438 [Obba rivulosa]|uniref:Heterokaryon incompatibility domain-containing protein n=1 Tax=Obba rivulosa TaxID=1052685 RepID=A0A8E2DIP3_9APHY|nr:hypothetical protein OBBRIDRAFT_106438 [Obba rivulosa]
MGRVIYKLPLSALAGVVVDIAPNATVGCYRLIDCLQYTSARILSIQEFSDASSLSYSAISYIWKGNPSPEQEKTASFSVKGAEDADPVSIDVLHQACMASLLEGADWLWLDCLCIIQTSRDDKAWQIERMYNIYKACAVSIVLPGGVSRLVPVDEETRWITRAWTLQEVTAPRKAVVLFSWEYGAGEWDDGRGGVKGRVIQVYPGTAMVPLIEVLKACFHPMALSWTPEDGPSSRDDISPSILGSYGDSSIGSLLWVLEMDDPDGRNVAIWRSSLLRASSRPVDMVFSIMGTFGVTLDPKQFRKTDRIGATIALAQQILRLGGKPVWLALSLDIPPSRCLSSFPAFPETDVSGDVHWETRHGPTNPNVADDIYSIDELNETSDEDEEDEGENASDIFFDEHWVTDIPSGSMDHDGYLTISAKAAPAVFTGQVFGRRRTNLAKNNDGTVEFADVPEDSTRVAATDGKIWDILPPPPPPSESRRHRNPLANMPFDIHSFYWCIPKVSPRSCLPA